MKQLDLLERPDLSLMGLSHFGCECAVWVWDKQSVRIDAQVQDTAKEDWWTRVIDVMLVRSLGDTNFISSVRVCILIAKVQFVFLPHSSTDPNTITRCDKFRVFRRLNMMIRVWRIHRFFAILHPMLHDLSYYSSKVQWLQLLPTDWLSILRATSLKRGYFWGASTFIIDPKMHTCPIKTWCLSFSLVQAAATSGMTSCPHNGNKPALEMDFFMPAQIWPSFVQVGKPFLLKLRTSSWFATMVTLSSIQLQRTISFQMTDLFA